MRIEKCTSPCFKAKFINDIKIGKKDFYPNYFREPVSFVQIEPNNSSDIDALEKVSDYWLYGLFAKNICYMARAIRDNSKHYKNHQVFALTSQKENFDTLDSEKILGLTGICPESKDKLFMEYIQVNPEMLYKSEPEYKGIGSAILDSLKNIWNKIYCYPSPTKSVINFYEKNGFFEKPGEINHYEWTK